MRFLLHLFELRIPSIESLELSDEGRLLAFWARAKELETVAAVRYFGFGDRLKPIEGTRTLVQEFRKHKAASYSFADVQKPHDEPSRAHWSVGLRQALVTARVSVEAAPGEVTVLTDELLTLNELLLSSVRVAQVDVPFSFLDVLEVPFQLPRPPRRFGRLSHRSLVDVVHLPSEFDEAERKTVEALDRAELIEGAERENRGDLVVIRWGDPARRPAEEILRDRYAWYAERADLPVDSSFNRAGDKEFALFDAHPVPGLTGYSPIAAKGVRAIVFDDLDDAREILDELKRMLESGTTSEGRPLRELTLIVPCRDDALRLHPLAEDYQMGLVYADDDGRLWDPFPRGYDTIASEERGA